MVGKRKKKTERRAQIGRGDTESLSEIKVGKRGI